jgi:tryptophanyl-tRNA synthetase
MDPWGDVQLGEYKKKMEKFGIDPVESLGSELPDHRLIRRNIVFGHRDFGKVLDAKNNNNKFSVMTGIMPSGTFHFGHKCVVDQIKMLQEMGAEVTVAAADIEAYNTRDMPLAESRQLVKKQYLTNYEALGLDISSIDFYFQSSASQQHMRKSKMFSKFLTENEVQSTYGSAEPNKIASALFQYADILRPQFKDQPKPTVVPVGIDQDPHIRLTREIARKADIDYRKPSSLYNKFMRGLQGGKMSSSKPKSYISLTEEIEEAKSKIDKAKTGGQDSLEEHRSKGGNVEEDMVYELLAFHLIEDDKTLNKIKQEYESGEMLSSELKDIAKQKIEEFLTEHQQKREEAEPKVEQYLAENH